MINMVKEEIEIYNELLDGLEATFDYVNSFNDDLTYLYKNGRYYSDYLLDEANSLFEAWIELTQDIEPDAYYWNSNEVFMDMSRFFHVMDNLLEFYQKYEPENTILTKITNMEVLE